MNYDRRIAADNLVKIDISTIYKLGAHWNGSMGWKDDVLIDVFTGIHEKHFVRLKYAEFEYDIPLVTTPCNYGGIRYWFECLVCKRRVGTVYFRANIFACRHCQFLTYESKLLSGRFKGIGRIVSIPEVDAAAEKVKRVYYNGKLTKNYIRFMNKQRRFYSAWGGHLEAIEKRSKRLF